jgi:hypothetical protein
MTDCLGNDIERIIAHVRKLCKNTQYEELSNHPAEIVLSENNNLKLECTLITISGNQQHLFISPKQNYIVDNSPNGIDVETMTYLGYDGLLGINCKIDELLKDNGGHL